ncbi:MAG: peptidoglycan-binding domain-containing protein [Caulobacter sp.]|nr:peptidoglycan-binding domain-containing protein [Caulobacter sp.]
MGRFGPLFGAASVAVLAVALLGAGAARAGGDGGDYPPNPVPGQCYQKVLIPEQYESYTEQVLEAPGRTASRRVPADYRDEERRELVCEARTETITIPATYRTVTETVVDRPGGYRMQTIPAEYETVTEQVLLRPARTEWRRGVLLENRPTAPGSTRMLPSGEVLCLVEVPAEYGLATRQVMRRPARTVRVQTPAETRTVTRQVIDQPARVERRVIPAEYRTVRTRVMVAPERVETYTAPPAYRTVTRRRLVSQARYEWQVILCEDGLPGTLPGYPAPGSPAYSPAPSSYGGYGQEQSWSRAATPDRRVLTSPNLVRAVQTALAEHGYYSGPRDGLAKASTQRSLARFQSDRRLAPGWTMETLRALGVPYP